MQAKFIQIGGDSRSGGSLIPRLFDGCNTLLALPFENEYFKDRNCELIKFDKFLESKNFNDLIQEECVNKIIKFGNDILDKKQAYTSYENNFNSARFTERLRVQIDLSSPSTPLHIYNILHESFFEELGLLGQTPFKSVSAIFNHSSRTFLANLEEFFSVFEKGYFLQTIRSPLGSIASMKGHSFLLKREYNAMPVEAIDWATQRWLISVLLACENKEKYTNYKIVIYDNLVEDAREELQNICDFIKIPFQEKMLSPTHENQAWHGNSSFGSQPPEINNKNRNKYKEILTPHEIDKIKGATESIWNELLAFSDCDSVLASGSPRGIQAACTEQLYSFPSSTPSKELQARELHDTLFKKMRELQL